jgi:hypothetical protein
MRLKFSCLFRGRGSSFGMGKGSLETQLPPISSHGEGWELGGNSALR